MEIREIQKNGLVYDIPYWNQQYKISKWRILCYKYFYFEKFFLVDHSSSVNLKATMYLFSFCSSGLCGSVSPGSSIPNPISATRKFRNHCFIRKKFGFHYLSVVNFWKFLFETEWNGSVYPGWYNQLYNFRIYCSICYVKFLKFQTRIFGQMESAHDHQDETSLLPIIK